MTAPLLRYTGCPLDRGDQLRRDPARLASRRADPESHVVPVWRARSALLVRGEPRSVSPLLWTPAEAKSATEDADWVFLGIHPGDDRAWFAVDLSALEEPERDTLVPGVIWGDLRSDGLLLDAETAATLAYARGLVHWHITHRHCGRCGAIMESRNGGHVRACTAGETCGREAYPRTDPAVIMLVVHPGGSGVPPRALLGRDPRWPAGVYSTLAGFVEPGESLEEAVAREVWEETGVRVTDAQYMASQPWPFPSSLMLGFRAVATTTALDVDCEEVEDAIWVTAEELRAFGVWGDPKATRALPRRDSIARYLIAGWAAEQGVILD